jgi:hypothetical protein
MRVHLPALLALVSATTYVACGSSDPANSDQEGGAGGEGGALTAPGGTPSTGGSQSNPGGGEGGVPLVVAGMPGGGAGGAAAGGEGGVGGGGEGGAAPDDGFPAACPGAIGDYLQIDGTTAPDTFTLAQLSMNDGKVYALGLDGDDVFELDNAGQDCLVGGTGDDDFSIPGESGSVMYGNDGADVYHLEFTSSNAPSVIADMTSEDTIALALQSNTFLYGQAGAVPDATQLFSVADYEAGTGSIPAGEGAAIAYDPATGGLWRDDDRGTKGTNASQYVKIGNPGSYTFDINDFVLE